MLADAVRLRRARLVLRPSELETPILGHLSVLEDDGKHSSLKRVHLSARRIEYVGTSGTPRSLVFPIFDVVLLRLEGDSFPCKALKSSRSRTPS